MTVAALVRGLDKTCNVLVVDSGAGSFGRRGEQYDCSHDKLRLAFGNTYFTLVGDALLANVLTSIVAWTDPKRPDLRRLETFHAVLEGLERLRQIQVQNGQPIAPNPGGAHLLVCSRDDAYYWQAAYDPVSGLFARPSMRTALQPGHGVVFWGNTVVPFQAEADEAKPFDTIIDAMFQVNTQVEAQGFKLPYPLTRRCSGVMLPHKGSHVLRRLRPFDSLPEQWARHEGDLALDLLNDSRFMDFPTIPT